MPFAAEVPAALIATVRELVEQLTLPAASGASAKDDAQ
jgi:hypothetical protein